MKVFLYLINVVSASAHWARKCVNIQTQSISMSLFASHSHSQTDFLLVLLQLMWNLDDMYNKNSNLKCTNVEQFWCRWYCGVDAKVMKCTFVSLCLVCLVYTCIFWNSFWKFGKQYSNTLHGRAGGGKKLFTDISVRSFLAFYH